MGEVFGFIVKTDKGTVIPADRMSEEFLNAVPNGTMIRVHLDVPRNPKFNQLYQVTTKILSEAHPCASHQAMKDYVRIATGFVRLTRVNGLLVETPAPMDFDTMDQIEFQDFMERFWVLACSQIIPGLGRDDLIRETLGTLGRAR